MSRRTARAARGIRPGGSGGIEEGDRRSLGRYGLELDPTAGRDAGHDGKHHGVGSGVEEGLYAPEQLVTVGLIRHVGADLRDVSFAEATRLEPLLQAVQAVAYFVG